MVKDTVANLIVKLKNAGLAGKASVSVPTSKFVLALLALLEKEGFIKSFSEKGLPGRQGEKAEGIEVTLAYDEDKKPKISFTERVSKLSRRVYKGARELRPVRSGFGISVLSTPKGVMSDREARKMKVGGEVLFKIW